MFDHLNRRHFLATAGQAVAAAAVLQVSPVAGKPQTPAKGPKLKKAVKIGMVTDKIPLVDKFSMLKDLGFDGVELNSPDNLDLKEVLDARDRSGLLIPGVVDSVHWRETLSHPDPATREKGLEALQTALRDAKAYGATSVLLVAAVVDKGISYADAYTRSQAEIRKAIPLAEELGVKILLENVWNNFLLSPLEFARYIDEFESPLIGAHFDVGNVVKIGWPEQWIHTLGKRIGKLDIKEFSRALMNEKGPAAGFNVEIGDGDCDWAAVMQALRDIGYDGWGTAEVAGGDRKRLKEISERMDRVFAM